MTTSNETQTEIPGPWTQMDRQPRRSLSTLKEGEIPTDPGVYAIYRGGQRTYVGKASSLRNRIWRNHCRRGAVLTGSALRRNVAEHLGVGTAADIKARRYQPTPGELEAVRRWLEACEVAWIRCGCHADASALEDAMKSEHKPPLTKR
jgi:hypothetical protein